MYSLTGDRKVLSYSYELGTGSILLIFGTHKQALGRVVIKEYGTANET